MELSWAPSSVRGSYSKAESNALLLEQIRSKLPKAQYIEKEIHAGCLQMLSIANCGLVSLDGLSISRLNGLAFLNVSFNSLRSLAGVSSLKRLQELWASNNRLRQANDFCGLS